MIFSSRLLMNTAQPLMAEGYPLTFTSERNKQAKDWSITGQGIGDVGADGLYHLNVVNSPLNLFNAMTGREERDPGNYADSTNPRPNINGHGIYKGFAVTGAYIPFIVEYTILDDNSLTLDYIGNDPYGVGFDFHLKPNTYYVCNCAENRQYIGAAFYKQDGTYIGWQYINNNTKWKIPDDCYWTVISLCGMRTDSVPLSFTDIGLYEAETLQQFEPYREPIVTSHTLAEPINGTVSYKDGMLRQLPVCKGYNNISIEGVRNSNNLFNAMTNREEAPIGAWENTAVRTFNGRSIFKGLHSTNYWYSGNCSYEIVNDNEIKVSSKNWGYGLGFDFKAKPNTQYTIQSNQPNKYISVAFYDEDGVYLSTWNGTTEPTYLTFTTHENCMWMLVVFHTQDKKDTFTFSNIQLEEGATATAYEPYKPKTNMTIKY